MKRRDFLEKVSGAVVAIQLVPITALAVGQNTANKKINIYESAKRISAPKYLQDYFVELLKELNQKDWTTFFQNEFAINIDPNNPDLDKELDRVLPEITAKKGFDDFAGIRLIEPGRPSMSLLYHALASPRVKPEIANKPFNETQYLGWDKLALLEDYIYSLLDLNIDNATLEKEYVLAVFSYEYRPAYKTPVDSPYADFVYSRTGISRIGQHPFNYNKKERSFTNLPLVASPKEIAVMPAKYALFLARVTPAREVNLMSEENGDVKGFSVFRRQRDFLVPVKKIYEHDPLLNGAKVTFYESHINEKLKRLSNFKSIKNYRDENTSYDLDKMDTPPFKKLNASKDTGETLYGHNSHMVSLIRRGSSVILSPIDSALMSFAKQNGKLIFFKVPPTENVIGNLDSNRRYTSLKLQSNPIQNIADVLATEGYAKHYKPTRFNAPRNAPLFTNIRHRVNRDDFKTITHLDGSHPDFYKEIKNGGYYTAMFEDNICDGFINAEIKGKTSSLIIDNMARNIFPAFSLVTAPDFFPYSESFDLMEFDKNKNRSFMIGGVENLSTARMHANPSIIDPISKKAAFPEYEEQRNSKGIDLPYTMQAVLTQKIQPTNEGYSLETNKYKQPNDRDYSSTSYMTDTGSFIFAPGWDATYSEIEKDRPFLATIGLGSPFPEDMKLCAAANGMWPVASPDSARTFQGSLEPSILGDVTPCAIPLTDLEIGIHESHPMLSETNTTISKCFGWDGEHGPFLNKSNNKFCVEFTDIARADYVYNLIHPQIGFNMELLRLLTQTEIINRMEALRKCKETIEGSKHEFSKLWLVSVEAVDWTKGAVGIGVPKTLIGENRDWAIRPQANITGNGYLYVFVAPQYEHGLDPSKFDWIDNTRRRLQVQNIYVCQLSKDAISYCQIPPEGSRNGANWKNG